MKKLLIISAATLGLAGCSATTTTVYRPVAPVTYPLPSAYPNTYPYARPYRYRGRVHCYTTWDRTPYGLRERRVCG
jgi:hypothetical protein